MTKDELEVVLEKHLLWLQNDPEGERADLSGADLSSADLRSANLSSADLSGADLRSAYLSGADLSGANLSGANLSGADLRSAYLSGADLRNAYLSGADLSGANLRSADLRSAYLSGADLSGANLRSAYLSGANLSGANLSGANLSGADLSGANLSGAKNIPDYVIGMTTIATVETKTGWKKLSGGLICKISIPPKAKRSNGTGRKCRCEFADVVEIWDGDEPVRIGHSQYDENFIYEVGNRVTCDKWNEDRWEECGGGIHFFLTRSEAEMY